MQNVGRDRDGDGSKQHAQIDQPNHEENREKNRDPKEGDGENFCPERDGLVFAEVADVITKQFVVHQPAVHTVRPFQEAGSR